MALLLSCAIFGARPARSAELKGLAASLPPETLIVVRVPSVPELTRQWQASAPGRYAASTEGAALMRPILAEIDDFCQTLASQGGVDRTALVRYLTGEFILAGLPAPEGSKRPIEWIWLFEHAQDPALTAALARPPAPQPGERISQQAIASAGQSYTRTTRVREVDRAIPVSGEGGKKKKHKDSGSRSGVDPALTIKQQVTRDENNYYGPSLIIHTGPSARAMEWILAHREVAATGGGGPAWLAPLAPLTGTGNEIEAYADGPAVSRWLTARAKKSKSDDWLDRRALGLESFRAGAAGLDFQDGAIALNAAVRVPEPRPGLGRLIMLGDAQAPSQYARLVPASAQGSWAARYPLSDLTRGALALLPVAAPAIGAVLQLQLGQFEQTTGVNVEQGLIRPLGEEYAEFTLPGAAGTADVTDEKQVTHAVALADPAAFRAALGPLLAYGTRAFGAYAVEEGKVGSWPLWTLTPARPGSLAPAGAEEPYGHLCVAGSWLLAGARREGIEAAVRQLQAGAAGDPALAAAMAQGLQRLPRERFAQFTLPGASLDPLLNDMLDTGSGKKKKNAATAVNGLGPRLAQTVNASLSRDGDTLRLRAWLVAPLRGNK